MAIVLPKLAVLDSSTLGYVSRDYCSCENGRRDAARTFLSRLQDLGVYVALTLTHVSELLRHGDEVVVSDRLDFLRSLPLVAWLRPYGGEWFPGSFVDQLCHELHAVVHGRARAWDEIISAVRPEFWETGTGDEMFSTQFPIWSLVPTIARDDHEIEKRVASVARTDPEDVRERKLCDVLRLPRRPKEKRAAYYVRFAAKMRRQLQMHGDKRLEDPQGVAMAFADWARRHVDAIDAAEEDLLVQTVRLHRIPPNLVDPEMTVGEFGKLVEYAQQLTILQESMQPKVVVTMNDIPPKALPSYVLSQQLAEIQRRAPRVSGSDLGDAYLAPLALYADIVVVDKRTAEFVNQLKRVEPKLSTLMGRYLCEPQYHNIPSHFG